MTFCGTLHVPDIDYRSQFNKSLFKVPWGGGERVEMFSFYFDLIFHPSHGENNCVIISNDLLTLLFKYY